ncbi:hypothetical protein CMV_028499 [Castanea mollissima]|uniref:NB-ARC domain-containing protein n=1 Tax=Castanea mollissima TaxID=60419 RepID=A0A8J4VC02_9ROSI|nr:hypothetical protein CMV_028499 [Castanea mollissima]
MARALVSTIIDQLGSLIASELKDRLGSLFASEVTSLVNVEEEVEKLKLKFQAIQAKLDDAEERQVKEKAVKLWKLFLVFDDVWTEDSMLWEPFRLALQNAAQGSRILVTTRKNRVADIMGSAARINLGQLSDDDCWTIFSTIAFSDRDSMQCKELEDIGRKISDKCKGLPLAARTLGSLMCFKSRKEQWEMVFYSRLWELQDIERVQRDGQEVIRQAMMKKSLTKNSMSDDEEEGQ